MLAQTKVQRVSGCRQPLCSFDRPTSSCTPLLQVDTLALITSCLDASLVSTTEALHNKKHASLVPVAVPFLPPP